MIRRDGYIYKKASDCNRLGCVGWHLIDSEGGACVECEIAGDSLNDLEGMRQDLLADEPLDSELHGMVFGVAE